jgi:hypothetical protein
MLSHGPLFGGQALAMGRCITTPGANNQGMSVSLSQPAKARGVGGGRPAGRKGSAGEGVVDSSSMAPVPPVSPPRPGRPPAVGCPAGQSTSTRGGSIATC